MFVFQNLNQKPRKNFRLLLKAIGGTREKFKAKEVVKTLRGEQNAIMISHHTADLPVYGQGKHKKRSLLDGPYSPS